MFPNQANPNINMNYINRIRNMEDMFYQMNPNSDPININMKNNRNSLISKINNSIMVPKHPHPLYSCITPERSKQLQFWTCNNCFCKYTFQIPSFYCTACDYDMCQKCLYEHPLYKIEIYNYNQNEKFLLNNVNVNNANYKPNIHEHPMALILFENSFSEEFCIKCQKCKNFIKNTEAFYYCSLCNFNVCQNCFKNQLNEYLSGDQMEIK